ncbi:uncharacterized protein [Drosophila pseudoobscura]|uniref:Uncharacterized protein n=1 Tax=Drosophila pseudoobscura pseudoobscura TaxID=46245 RepID=A0A6I8V9B3_DROPS|nr:uncharacterized protein LOC26532146 [Drosophila pseudoobscura]
MCFKDPRNNALLAGVSAISFAIITLFIEFVSDQKDWFVYKNDWKIKAEFGIWILIGLAAVALLVGAFLKNRYIVLVWLVVVFVCGIVLLVFYIVFIGKATEHSYIISGSLRFAVFIPFFVIWTWLPLLYYRELSGDTLFCK